MHRALGPGLLESAFEACLCHELVKAGLAFEQQLILPIRYDGVLISPGYRIDILVERLVVVEIKTVEALTDVHRAQLLSYLTLGGYRLGYLLNFNTKMLKNGICRLVKDL